MRRPDSIWRVQPLPGCGIAGLAMDSAVLAGHNFCYHQTTWGKSINIRRYFNGCIG